MAGGGRESEHPDAEALRRAYARHLLTYNGILDDTDLLRAFSVVPREKFLGPPPWRMHGFGRRAVDIAQGDLDHVYRDVLFALDEAKGINNGEPSLHARLIHALAPKPGERIVHVGAGTGYYSAIIAELVGPTGHVLAIETDARLADMARANLSDRANAEVIAGDGAGYPRQEVDCVYVSFAVAAPAAAWVDMLAPGGRLIFPLGVPGDDRNGVRYSDQGAMLYVVRQGMAFSAQFLSRASFIFGEAEAGATKPELVNRLRHAFASGHMRDVRSLIWRTSANPQRCWFHSDEWSLCYDPPEGG